MVVLARQPKACLALVWGLCGCPGEDSPAVPTTTRTNSTSDTGSTVPTTSATDLATTPDPAATSSTTDTTGTLATTSTTTSDTTSIASTGEPTTTAGSLEDCGDGELQPGEQCDLGFAENLDTGACTSQCRLPTCGDGFVWQGHELCDDADANNDTTWNGCRTDCTPGPHCNDGILQPDNEECDLGPEWNGSGESKDPDHVPCTDQCRLDGRLMFISSAKYTGDLGGLSGADELCQDLALTAGLDNHINFIAWLSDGGASPKTRIPQLEGSPFVQLDGTIIADDLDDLITNGPRFGVYIDELGASQELDPLAWTNTLGDGTEFTSVFAQHCVGWLSAMPNHTARLGLGFVPTVPEDMWTAWKMNRWWTDYESKQCHKLLRLYCLEK